MPKATVVPATRRRRGNLSGAEPLAGWLFVAPAIIIIGIFLFAPILLALWVSFTDWNGRHSPINNPRVDFIGLTNYASIISEDTLMRTLFGRSIRNNIYYVALVVPLQTALALFLAVQVNKSLLKAKGFFRTAFYFPSVTSSIAITGVFMFLFQASGAVNAVLAWLGIHGPNWFADPSGVFHKVYAWFGVTSAPPGWDQPGLLGVSTWDWLGGPSVAQTVLIMMAIFTTSGTFMLLFLAGLQNIGAEVGEAAIMDGASNWQTFWHVTLPTPALITLTILSFQGSWNEFAHFVISRQSPQLHTLTTGVGSLVSGQLGSGNQFPVRLAAAVLMTIPVAVLFFVFQRRIMSTAEGAEKG